MTLTFFISVCLQLTLFHASRSLKFEDITSEIFPLGDDTGIIATFGHFNTDEFTDVISLQQKGKKLQLFKGSEDRPYFQSSLNCSFGSIINGVIPGDYNGDSILDFLIILSPLRSNVDGTNDIRILWGNNETIECKSETIFTIKNHPFVVDFNGDMIPDIIAENEDFKRCVWISSKNKIFTLQFLPNITQNLILPHSSGLIDLNCDLASDILMMGESHIETWYHTGQNYVQNVTTNIPYPDTTKYGYKWQSTFVDMNLDGKLDLIMPVCYDAKCVSSAVLIWNENLTQWETILNDFQHPDDKSLWGFKIYTGAFTLELAATPTTLRAGDIDMDGFPDFITIIQSKKNPSIVRGVIMRNVPCNDDCFSGRKIEIDWNVPGLKDISDVLIATFFDIFEDGTLDILLTTNTNEEWKIHALRNTQVFDSNFLKVLVLSGLCSNCTTEPYGLNQPGPIVRYNMTTQEGRPLVSTLIQLSQSAHFPLQLPYSLFGLGQTPNFIDILTVSIPAAFNVKVHKREWVQIIPNSQIVVIPNPPSDEQRWTKKLFVTPSHLILLTCISLMGTCVIISLLVALLHWKERMEDKKEKMQDAYRFHFDAM